MIERVKLADLRVRLKPPPDGFLCMASFEERCRSIATSIEKEAIKSAAICHNADNRVLVGRNADWLESHFGDAALKTETDSRDPLLTAIKIGTSLKELEQKKVQHLLIDITTFTHESLLIVLKLVPRYLAPDCRVTLAYTSAEDYDPQNSKPDEKWLSKGVAEVRPVLGFPGVVLPSRRTHLIILVGFEYERASRLVMEYEPNRVSLGTGDSAGAISEKHWAANQTFHRLVTRLAAQYAPVEHFEFSISDPDATSEMILQQARRFPDHNVVVAPMNTKLSTVGCALAAWKDKRVQLCYAPALIYNHRSYSVPSDRCYLLSMPRASEVGAR